MNRNWIRFSADGWAETDLAFVGDAGVETVRVAVAAEVDLVGQPRVERVVAHVEALELVRQVRIVDVVDLHRRKKKQTEPEIKNTHNDQYIQRLGLAWFKRVLTV